MSPASPPVLGFNNNVRHRGRVFHIQTEDSGVKSPRIVTHLFADGGRIIKTTRTSYAELIGRADLPLTVRQLMKDQHKSMFTALRTGDLDELLESSCGPLPLPAAPRQAATAESAVPSASNQSSQVLPVAPAIEQTLDASPSSGSSPNAAPAGRNRSLTNPNMYKSPPSAVPPASREAIDLAVGSVETLGHEPPSLSSLLSAPLASDPPQNRKGPPPSPRKTRASASSSSASSARPASRYGSVPTKSSRSIFGDGVISEKSLDEVILSYLAEDLDGSSD